MSSHLEDKSFAAVCRKKFDHRSRRRLVVAHMAPRTRSRIRLILEERKQFCYCFACSVGFSQTNTRNKCLVAYAAHDSPHSSCPQKNVSFSPPSLSLFLPLSLLLFSNRTGISLSTCRNQAIMLHRSVKIDTFKIVARCVLIANAPADAR